MCMHACEYICVCVGGSALNVSHNSRERCRPFSFFSGDEVGGGKLQKD